MISLVHTYLPSEVAIRTLACASFNTDQFQIVAGIEGFINDSWAYDVSIQHGETNRVNTNAGYTNVANIANALNAVSETTIIL